MVDLRVGVLALQGCVERHRPHLVEAGAQFQAVKTEADLASVDALILPGGESSTMLKLIERFSLTASLTDFFARRPVWGICAGAILMASSIDHLAQASFNLIDMRIRRNAYGNQNQSFESTIEGYSVCFIRAPQILQVGERVQVRARLDGAPIWVQQGFSMATTFHPELSSPTPSPMHRAFVALAKRRYHEMENTDCIYI